MAETNTRPGSEHFKRGDNFVAEPILRDYSIYPGIRDVSFIIGKSADII